MGHVVTYRDVLYNMKRDLLIIGLTGYTGSGCTTASRILSSSDKPRLPALVHTESEPDEKRYEKLARIWEATNWDKFTCLQVSHVIFLMALEKAMTVNSPPGDLATIRELALSDKDMLQGARYLRKSEQEPDEVNIANALIQAYDTAKRLYLPFKRKCQHGVAEFTQLMQDFGDDIRKGGCVRPDIDGDATPQHILVLPEALRRLIQAHRTCYQTSSFVIDAFRNPYEVEFFKRRYSEFYLVHIQRDHEHRLAALANFNEDALKMLQEREKGLKVDNRERSNIAQWVTSQNIDDCAARADCYIDNREDRSRTYPRLRYHLVKLIALAQHPGCIPPSNDERCMQMAVTARQSSGCLSRHVGAVVTDTQGFVLGVGWNDPPRGQLPCSVRTRSDLLNKQDPKDFSAYERSAEFVEHIRGGGSQPVPFCFRDEYSRLTGKGKKAEYTRALHAEENALLQAARHGSTALEGGLLYTTDSPCTLCAKKAYQVGIARISYIEEYPGDALDQTIRTGTRAVRLDKFEGITGSAYFRLFAPLAYEKDLLTLYEDSDAMRGDQ